MTMKSAFNASRLRAVSLSVSPFLSEEASAVKLIISAERRCSQSSKLIRVRVDGSTNRLMTVLPRNAGTFFMARSPTALKARAVSSTSRISSALRDSISSKCLRVHGINVKLQRSTKLQIPRTARPPRGKAVTEVAQVSNLLYRRFPIGRALESSDGHENANEPQAGSPAIRQVGNLRYFSGSRVVSPSRHCSLKFEASLKF